LEYTNDLRRALAELARVVRPGGRIVISFPDYAAPYSVAQMRVWYPAMRLLKSIAPFDRPAPQRRMHLVSPSALQRLAAASGHVASPRRPAPARPTLRPSSRRLREQASRGTRATAARRSRRRSTIRAGSRF